MANLLTVGIATKNRPAEVARCLQSIRLLKQLECEVIIIDDGSDESVEESVRGDVAEEMLHRVTFLRWESSRNLMAARNEIVRRAKGDVVLILDDDAYVLDADELEHALKVFRADKSVGAMAFPERDAEGLLKPKQPGDRDEPCYTTHFYGYAHAVKRESFIRVGGYQEFFGFYHEESDFCKKLLDIRCDCVYWPRARVAHVPSSVERTDRRLLRFQYGARNRCLDAMCNEPFPLNVITVSLHCLRYAFRERGFRREYGEERTGGPWWLARALKSMKPQTRRVRKPLSWRVFLRWRLVRLLSPKYTPRLSHAPQCEVEAESK